MLVIQRKEMPRNRNTNVCILPFTCRLLIFFLSYLTEREYEYMVHFYKKWNKFMWSKWVKFVYWRVHDKFTIKDSMNNSMSFMSKLLSESWTKKILVACFWNESSKAKVESDAYRRYFSLKRVTVCHEDVINFCTNPTRISYPL